jgi:hypothetical protein
MSSARTLALEIDALLHPVRAFSHPMDVVRNTDLTCTKSERSSRHGHPMPVRKRTFPNYAKLPVPPL